MERGLPLQDASEGIACLTGVSYRWSDPKAPQARQIGLIAQEVEQCFPEVVTTADNGYKSVAYARLVAPLIEAVKAQQDAIAIQNASLEGLRRELELERKARSRLEARLNRLETSLSIAR